MNSIKIFWGSDVLFNDYVNDIGTKHSLSDVISHLNITEHVMSGVNAEMEPPMKIENLVINTDDYGSLREWALSGFSVNILQNNKLDISNLLMNNPPTKIYEDVKKIYYNILEEQKCEFKPMSVGIIKKIVSEYDQEVIGQKNVILQIAPTLYSLIGSEAVNPKSILFLGESGVGKTETAKFISECLDSEMLRIQFSMLQTSDAYNFIFGAKHGENSLGRELIRRKSNVILLDEFDKVQTSFYNAFYQMFDEGIFVDANYSVNMSNAIIICTSNYTNEKEAERHLGTPIYSRFSKVIKFSEIAMEDRILIANKIYENLVNKLRQDDRKLISENNIINIFTAQIRKGLYKNIRMLKNDIEYAINYEILKKLEIT